MNFQSLPLPPPRLQRPGDLLRSVRQCGCNCIAGCRCTCNCSDHCICESDCRGDCAARVSRNLVVSIDEVPNKLGFQKTNVAELHSRILVDAGHEQLTYYDCAIGTYASSHSGRVRDFFGRIENTVDRVLGWTFKKNILQAYRWVCEHYKPGDRLFLFGFSRGAYQVRTLAALIDTVGLVNAGNLVLVPSAYDVFLRTQSGQVDAVGEAVKFKASFARSIQVHFVGVWDAASSAGLGGPALSSADHACIFRHALALDECREKLHPADTPSQPKLDPVVEKVTKNGEVASSIETKVAINVGMKRSGSVSRLFPALRGVEPGRISEAKTNIKNTKEVWFAGTHVDMGGGLNCDPELSSIPLLWMENEAASAGLHLRSRASTNKGEEHRETQTDARTEKYCKPSRRLQGVPCMKYLSNHTRAARPSKGRFISRGQRIHASVAFMAKDYRPLASFRHGDLDWQNLVGHDIERRDFRWASRYSDLLEMDLFAPSLMIEAIQGLTEAWNVDDRSDRESYWIERLSFMALSGKLCSTYLSTSTSLWDDDPEVELVCAVKFFQKLADQQPVIFGGDVAEMLEAQGRFFYLRGKGKPDTVFEDALFIRRANATEHGGSSFKGYKLAASLTWFASYAVAVHKPQKALYLFEEAVDTLRLLLIEEYSPAFPLFALLQRNFTTCLENLSGDGDIDTALRLAETIISLSRALAQSYPQYIPVLAAALHDRAFGFSQRNIIRESHAAEDAINLYRDLAKQNPDTYEAPFSDALYNISIRLFALGQYANALSASLEEAQFRRALKDKECLATCLEQLSRCFVVTGKMNMGCHTAEEAVRIRRKLVEETMLWQFESQLGDSLNNLSCCLSLDPRGSQNALNAVREATSIQRGLARDMSARIFHSRLGIFLHNLSVGLSGAARHEEALRAAQEALDIQSNRGEDSDRALALSRVASCLRAVGKPDEASHMAEDCLSVARGLMVAEHAQKRDTQRTGTQLAESLFAISFCLPAKQAVQVVRDSVTVYRELVKFSSPAMSTAFARALLRLSRVLLSTEQPEEALRVAAEATQIGRGLAKDCFSACLYHLSLCLHTVGQPEQGMESALQCVALRRDLVQEYGTWQFKEKLADALFNLSSYSHPRSPTALQVVREAVELERELFEYVPAERFNQRLVDGLQNLAALALLVGQNEEALSCAEEAVDISRKLVETDPSQHSPGLVNVLYTYANVLCEDSHYEEGYSAMAEADTLRQDVCCESDFGSLEAGAAYLSARARCLVGMNLHDEGLLALMDAIKLYRRAFETVSTQSTFESFPWFFKNVFGAISALAENGTQVIDVLAETISLCRLLARYSPERFNCYFKEALALRASSFCSPEEES